MTINPYDAIPYPSYAYPSTSPGNLATLAILSGRDPAPVESCRVLELGCGEGGNLLPMAATLPGAEFVGVDLAGSAIGTATRLAGQLGLANVRFQREDIGALDESLGRFDYILAYGVYSWIPPDTRDRMMDLLRRLLRPRGVAFVSYNVFPGWRQFGTLRDAMLFHARRETTPEARLARAKEILDLLAAHIPDRAEAYRHFYRETQALFADLSDSYVAHDFLEDVNEPLWFGDFIAHARQHGLQFLANAEPAGPETLPPALEESLGELGTDPVDLEQYRDLFTNRSFRETLLVHDDGPISRRVDLGCLERLCIASRLEPVDGGEDPSTPDRVEYRAPGGAGLSSAHPPTKTALAILRAACPRAIPYGELRGRIMEQIGPFRAEDDRLFAQNLLLAYAQNIALVQLHPWSPPVATEVGDRPQILSTARLQARQGVPVTNWFHQRVKVDELSRTLMAHVDGTHAPDALVGADPDLGPQDVRYQLEVFTQLGLLKG